MKIKWLGHAAFLLKADNGTRIITDPYQSGSYNGTLKYEPIKESADIVTLSHHHPDHGYPDDIIGKPRLVDKTVRDFIFADIKINGYRIFHDSVSGRQRGENTIFRFDIDDLRVCHMGDIGHLLDGELINTLKPIDVLLIPVGGTATINAAQAEKLRQQLKATITIPMHFRNEKCLFNIDPVDNFLRGKTNVVSDGNSEVKITADNLPAMPEIVVLRPAL